MFKNNIKSICYLILFVYLPTVLGLLLVGLISVKSDIPIMDFTRDPLSVMDAPFYIGIVSNIGIVFWAAGATICFFASAIVSRLPHSSNSTNFLLFGGIITTVLLLDDLFLLHEQVFPQYLNTSEKLAFFLYFLMVLAYVTIFRKKILATNLAILALSFLGFAGSIVVDEIFVEHFTGKFLIEDGLKLLGILTWMVYFAEIGIAEIANLKSKTRS